MVSWKVGFANFNVFLSLLREIVISGSEILIFVQRCCKTKRDDDTSNEIFMFFCDSCCGSLEKHVFEWFRGSERTGMRAARVLSFFEHSAQSFRVFELEVVYKTWWISIKTHVRASVHVISTCVFPVENLRKKHICLMCSCVFLIFR